MVDSVIATRKTGVLLRAVARRHVRSQREHLACTGDVTPVECHLLTELARCGPSTSAQLAARLEMDKGQLSRALTELERRGRVTRSPVASDARATLISLTASGRRRHAHIERALNAHAVGVLDRLSPAERSRVHEALELLARAYQLE